MLAKKASADLIKAKEKLIKDKGTINTTVEDRQKILDEVTRTTTEKDIMEAGKSISKDADEIIYRNSDPTRK